MPYTLTQSPQTRTVHVANRHETACGRPVTENWTEIAGGYPNLAKAQTAALQLEKHCVRCQPVPTKHGTRTAYNQHHCRCPLCRAAVADYIAQWRKHTTAPSASGKKQPVSP